MWWSSASAPRARGARRTSRAGTSSSRSPTSPVSDLADFYTRLWALGPAGVAVPLRIQRDADVFDVEIRSADRAALLKKPSVQPIAAAGPRTLSRPGTLRRP